jgi:mannose-1-phosphate guanylyltransferase/mannose-6-phosphate isomerase
MTILVPVVLSGGAGSRLWPSSRESHPKPFMKLPDGETLIEKTYKRAARLASVFNENKQSIIVTVTNRDYYFISSDEFKKIDTSGVFILEPFARNTAAAIAMAALYIKDFFGSSATMLVLSADHLITDDEIFELTVKKAFKIAQSKKTLVTFGIIANTPETGFGYIKAGCRFSEGFIVDSFAEKPDLKTAKKYIDSGNYFWNSGMFCFSVDTFLNELYLHAPNVFEASKNCWAAVTSDNAHTNIIVEIPEEQFREVPNISIDYALLEHSKRVAMVTGDFGWNDIGSWKSFRDLIPPDVLNNKSVGDVVFVDTKNTFVQSENRLVAAVGLSNLMIIDTSDALLVVNENNSQDVKQVVNILKEMNHSAYKYHKTTYRPWGNYTILEEGLGFKIKRIEVKPKSSLSLQSHKHRSEHWVVVKGEAFVLNDNVELVINQNESTFIPAGCKHRLSNRKNSSLILIEVQCGFYLGEDDIVRYQDVYGRIKNFE